ncbi:MAG: FAD-dependent oxidoreductase [Dehalococcoidia bacterium]|nr:FAD-dependent oxidoreductase [Dehalococcoidia bacterium]
MRRQEEDTHGLLFAPLQIGSMRLKNRIVLAPMGIGAARQGFDADYAAKLKAFVTQRARGGVGLIMLSGFVVDPRLKSILPLHDDTTVVERSLLKEVAEAGHSAGAMMGIQLNHPGRQMLGDHKKGTPLVAPSPIPWSRRATVPRELSISDIEELVRRFAVAAGLVKEAGFDMVEVHGAHGMLVSQFLSVRSNKRTDEYGGDLNGRARFAVEVMKAIKRQVGSDFPLSCRINGSDNIPGGITIDDAKSTARILEKAGIDIVSVSAGAYGSKPSSLPPFDVPQGCFVPFAESIKSVVKIPVVTVGRIADPWLAEDILKTGKADLIAMCRALIADPELPKKALEGRAGEIRRCIACNCCIERADEGLFIACVANPDAGREWQPIPSAAVKSKRVIVMGGGLAGLEAARVCALRGHHVTLYEEKEQLGGQWLLAASAPHKQDFRLVLDNLSREVRGLGVTVKLNTAVTPDLVKQADPDVVILATGALPTSPPIPGIERDFVVSAWDVLGGQTEVGQRALVVGGGGVGLETAEYLALRGRNVIVAEMLEQVGADMVRSVRGHLMGRLNDLGVVVHVSTRIEEIAENAVTVCTNEGSQRWEGIDTVVVAAGSKPRNEMAKDIAAIGKEMYVIGDAFQPAGGLAARQSGLECGLKA